MTAQYRTNASPRQILLVKVHRASLNSRSSKDLVLPDEIPAQAQKHGTSPQDAAPVHSGWSHGDGNGEESKHPCNAQPAYRDDVDSKAISSPIPWS